LFFVALPIAIEYAATRMGPAQRFDISRGSLCQYRGQRGATGSTAESRAARVPRPHRLQRSTSRPADRR